MGGKSSSKSSNSNVTNQVDKRVGATDSAIVVQDSAGSKVTVTNTTTDHGAVQGSLETVESVAQMAFGAIRENNDKAFTFAEEARKQADEGNWQQTVKWGALASVSYFAFKVFK